MALQYVLDASGNYVLNGSGKNVVIGGDFATFTLIPDAVLTTSTGYNTLITNTTYGKERRRNKWTAPRRRFTLQFNNIDEDDMFEIRDFVIEKGNFDTFSWEHPIDSVTYTVRFVDEKLKISYVGYNLYNVQFDFIEVLS